MKNVRTSFAFFLGGALTCLILLSNCSTKQTETSTETTQKDSTQLAYACPMHLDVTGKEGDVCPTCHMKLELVKTADSTKMHGH